MCHAVVSLNSENCPVALLGLGLGLGLGLELGLGSVYRVGVTVSRRNWKENFIAHFSEKLKLD